MAFQFVQIIQLLIYIIIGFLFWKIKNKKARVMFILIALTIFLVNPIRFKQEGMSKIERRSSSISVELPKKVIVDLKSFEQKQLDEMKKLKTQSTESVKNETN